MTDKPVVFRIDHKAGAAGVPVSLAVVIDRILKLLDEDGSRSFTVHRIETPTCNAVLWLGEDHGYELRCEREKDHGSSHHVVYEGNLISWDLALRTQ